VLFIDLDDFKAVNDNYGHDTGDQLLVEAARRIESCLRHGDLAARLGGDEFAVLLRDATVDDARGVAERLAYALAQPVTWGSITVDCKASIGLAYTDDGRTPGALMRYADTALYGAKAAGKGQWREYGEDRRAS
jgi:diguanylate cyclase (GGDEF)-like protein